MHLWTPLPLWVIVLSWFPNREASLTWPGSRPCWWFPAPSCLTSLICCPSTFVYVISKYVPGLYTDSTNHASTITAVPAHAHAQRMHKHQQPFRIFSKLRQMVFYDSRDGWRQCGAASAFLREWVRTTWGHIIIACPPAPPALLQVWDPRQSDWLICFFRGREALGRRRLGCLVLVVVSSRGRWANGRKPRGWATWSQHNRPPIQGTVLMLNDPSALPGAPGSCTSCPVARHRHKSEREREKERHVDHNNNLEPAGCFVYLAAHPTVPASLASLLICGQILTEELQWSATELRISGCNLIQNQ